jgi:anti-anti-sigma regulatory factor
MELDLRVQHHDDRAVVHVGGEVDLATCPQLRGVLAELVDQASTTWSLTSSRSASWTQAGSAC